MHTVKAFFRVAVILCFAWNLVPCVGSAQVTFEYESVYLKSFLTGDDALRVNGPGLSTSQDFEHDLSYSPRFTLSFGDPNATTFRGRYWNYDTDATQTIVPAAGQSATARIGFINSPLTAASGQTLITHEKIGLQTTDLEAAHAFRFHTLRLNLGAGVRQLNSDLIYDAAVVDGSRRNIQSNFDGVGPTLFAEFSKPTSYRGFSVFSKARYSTIFGSKKRSSYEVNSGGSVSNPTRFNNNESIQIADIQLGLRWTRDIGRHRLFSSMACEAQAWNNFGYDAPVQNTGQLSQSTRDLSLIGLAFTTGFCW